MNSSLTSPSSRGPSYLSSTSEYRAREIREIGGGGGRIVGYIITFYKAELIERG